MISIIVPVYRAEKYIVRCLDSLRTQTFSDIEVLLVDDRGGDNSITIIQQYIQSYHLDKTWRIITMPTNSGPAAARNVGIEEATGEYIAFCDADDWLEPTMLETLYVAAKKWHAEISSSAAILDYDNGQHRLMMNPHVGNGELTEAKRKYMLKHYVSNFTTCLFEREWMMRYALRFPDSRSGEDSAFMGCCYLMAKSIAQTDEPMYHYVIHEDSISHRRHVWRGGEKRRAFGRLIRFAKAQGLWHTYASVLCLIYVKKAWLTAIREYITT